MPWVSSPFGNTERVVCPGCTGQTKRLERRFAEVD